MAKLPAMQNQYVEFAKNDSEGRNIADTLNELENKPSGTKLYLHIFGMNYIMKDTNNVDRTIFLNFKAVSTKSDSFVGNNISNGLVSLDLTNFPGGVNDILYSFKIFAPSTIVFVHNEFLVDTYVPGTGPVSYTIPAGHQSASISSDNVTPL